MPTSAPKDQPVVTLIGNHRRLQALPNLTQTETAVPSAIAVNGDAPSSD
jgi:hypothetical protein